MPNVLTDLAADIYKAADIVGREIVGFIPSSTINAGTEGAAIGQPVRSHFTRQAAAANISPSMTIPEGTDQTVDNKTLTMTKQRGVPIPWTGEDIKYVNGGSGFETIYGDQIAQAMRTLTNEIEADLAVEAYRNASRAVGAAGTTPFGSDYKVVAEARQILVDNGMPVNDGRLSMVINSIAGTNLRNLAKLQDVNTSGNDTLLRQGVLLPLQGVMIKESAQNQAHTKGTATGLDAAGGESVGETNIALDGGDGGTLLPGDVVTFAGDTVNKYVVNTGFTAAAGTAIIGGPGMRNALGDGVEMTIGNSYTANVLFHQSAIELAMRPPAKPVGGDAAVDVMMVQDPHSGLVFEISVYKGFNKMMIFVGAVWGVKAWKPDAIALVMG
jgi:hypothetical protein